jgi:hypothetical protein
MKTVTISCDPRCKSADHSMLQHAVDACEDGDVIRQCECEYCAPHLMIMSNINVTRRITIQGKNREVLMRVGKVTT